MFRWSCCGLQAQLEMIMSANGLSENVFEIASKSLAAWEKSRINILLEDIYKRTLNFCVSFYVMNFISNDISVSY